MEIFETPEIDYPGLASCDSREKALRNQEESSALQYHLLGHV